MKLAHGRAIAIGAAGAAMVWAALVAGSVPARAFDDKPSSFDPLLNVVGLGKDSQDKPDIDFRERPPLVVPKSNDLPPPVAGVQHGANWPVDPGVERRRQAAAEARRPRAISPNENPVLSKGELQQGRVAKRGSGAAPCETMRNGIPDCSELTPAEKLKQVFSLGSSDDTAQPGVEPTRDYLTEPPSGYRAPKQIVKAGPSGPVRKYEAPSAADYARGINPNKTSDDN